MARLIYDMERTVAWSECDAAGISYYAKHFEWFTDGYMQFLDHHGFPYMDAFHHKGISIVTLKADSDYRRMLRPLEKITVRTALSSFTRTRLAFTYQIMKEDGELAAEGSTSHAFVNENGRPINLEKHFPALWGKLLEQFASK